MVYTPLKAYPNFGTRIANPPIPIPASVADGTTWSSDLMPGGFGAVTFFATSDHVVTLEVQRFADLAGLVPVGGLASVVLVAATPGYTGFTDGVPYMSFAVAIVNASGSVAVITNAAILTGPLP